MKKIKAGFLAGALALALLVPTVSVATTDAGAGVSREDGQKGMHHYSHKAHREQIMELVKKYSPELEEQFQSTFEKMEKMKKQHWSQLDDATKEKLAEIRKKVKEGTLTREQAREEMAKLGIEFRHKDGKHKEWKHFKKKHAKHKDDIHKQLMQAVEANDEAKIKELLAQLLARMQERVQQKTG